MLKTRLLVCLAILIVPAVSFAEQKLPQIPNLNAPAKVKQEWLRQQVLSQVRNKQMAKNIEAEIAAMNPKQLDAAFVKYRALMLRALHNLRQAQALRNQQQFGQHPNRFNQGWGGGGNVGFMPNITWLPQGASLNVGAVVSPDRRYVRINANPFFSSIPQVDTFQYAQPYNPYQGFQPSFGGQQQQQQPKTKLKVWHDGLRTRYERVPVK